MRSGILISIPSGAINRQFGLDFSVYKIISIPSGAINRMVRITVILKITRFQFLLVRLIARH